MMQALQPAKTFFALANALRLGELPLFDYLEQLEERFDRREGMIHAFVSEPGRFARLRQQGQQLLDRYPDPESRPPLFGIPIGVKDVLQVAGFTTRAGSQLPAELLQGAEAQVVTILRDAGALILGKTVTTEFAYFAPGPTRNPYRLNHTPGGSSSGSAAAVSAGLTALSLGTQTIGSITRPAAYCGIVGYKPTYDRISRAGVIPLAPSVDHVGVFSPDVAGADLAASLLCPDWQLVVTHAKPVLGIPDGPFMDRVDPEGRYQFQRSCQLLRQAGFVLKTVAAMADFEEIMARHQLIVAAEAAQVHADWFDRYGHLYQPSTRALIQKGQEVPAEALFEALAGRQKLRAELTALMDRYDLDLWLCPAAVGSAPPGLESTGDPVMSLPWTHSGLPTVCLPSGFDTDGLPFALQVIGRWYEDESLLDWAAEMELIIRPEMEHDQDEEPQTATPH
jgi:Asp-tRNA(Asn)/Glu-tRNA(Gln) amidotransferase A subunit family amidase